jgi:hypothetical protein
MIRKVALFSLPGKREDQRASTRPAVTLVAGQPATCRARQSGTTAVPIAAGIIGDGLIALMALP